MPVWSTSLYSLAEATHDSKYVWIKINFDPIKDGEAVDLIVLLFPSKLCDAVVSGPESSSQGFVFLNGQNPKDVLELINAFDLLSLSMTSRTVMQECHSNLSTLKSGYRTN